jgi:putative FmdB family regulatory protein
MKLPWRIKMPMFDFECKKCNQVYEDLVNHSNPEKKIKCPFCSSKSKTKLVSKPNFNFSNPVGTDRWNSESNGHQYRFDHNRPNVKKQREHAEQKSHMGNTFDFYKKHDDLNKDENWGPAK